MYCVAIIISTKMKCNSVRIIRFYLPGFIQIGEILRTTILEHYSYLDSDHKYTRIDILEP